MNGQKYLDGIQGDRKEQFMRYYHLGDSLCKQCYSALNSLLTGTNDSLEDKQPSTQSRFKKLNELLLIAGLQPRKSPKRTHEQNSLFGEMIDELTNELKSWFDIQTDETKFQKLVARVNTKIETASNNEALSLLTLFSGIISNKEIRETFNVSKRASVKAAWLLQERGVLEAVPVKKGHPLPLDVRRAVRNFYLDETNCRISPNMQDVVTICDFDGRKEQVAGRYLLMTTRELYSAFVTKHSTLKISLSSFTKQRPACCRFLGDMKKEVCVCTYHDNLEMMFKAIGIRKYAQYLKLLVCDADNKACMYRRCQLCKTKDVNFRTAIRDHCSLSSNLQSEGVTFQQWCLTDRSTQVGNK